MKGPIDEYIVLAVVFVCLTAVVANPTTFVICVSAVAIGLAFVAYIALQKFMRKRSE